MGDCLVWSFPGLDVELGEGKAASWVPHRQHWGHGMALGSCLQGWLTSAWRARSYLFPQWKSPWSVFPSAWSGSAAPDPCDELNVAVPSQIPLTSNLLQMERFHAFLRLRNIPLCIHYISFIHSSVDGHLACSHVLAIVNSVALNTGVRVSFRITVFEFFGDRPRVELLGRI